MSKSCVLKSDLMQCVTYLDCSMSCLKDHKEEIGIYVGPKRAINHSLKYLEKYRFMGITGEGGK